MNRFFTSCFATILATVSITFTTQNIYAWGVLGHNAAAQVAIDILMEQNSPALLQVNKILQTEDMVTASTWADEVRSSPKGEWSHTGPYHYEKIADGDSFINHLKNQPSDLQKKGGPVEALLKCEDILSDAKSSLQAKEYAVRFLIHFIADIHQPLHTGPIDDNGGNKTSVNWNGFPISLHQVWDSQIIALGHKNFFDSGSRTEQIQKYANYLISINKNNLFLKDQNKTSYQDWIAESMVPRVEAYTHKDDGASSYTQRFLPIVDDRVYLAGVRIAFIFNKIFPGYSGLGKPTQEGISRSNQLRLDINKIVGSYSNFINLEPVQLH